MKQKRIEYYTDKRGDFAFRFMSANNKILCSGEGYKNRADRTRAVKMIATGFNAMPIVEVEK